MSEEKIKLVPKKKHSKFHDLFAKKKSRYLMMFLLMLPFLIGIGIFVSVILKEINNLKALATTGPVETRPANVVTVDGNNIYILRDNATDLQKDYFAQLKDMIESSSGTGEQIAALIGQNFVSDFYTWTNKQGQFDVGGMIYVYDGEFEDGEHFKENVYQNARYGFYKYMSYYGNQYGVENLLEVDNVEVIKCQKMAKQFVINEHVANMKDENGDWFDYREDHAFDAYEVSLSWTYNNTTPLTLSQFANSMNMIVIDYNGRYLIIEADEKEVQGRTEKEELDVEGEEESESQDSKTE